MLFLVSALRALIELIGLCLLGQGALYLLTGAGRERNPIYRLFALLTAPPRRLVRGILPDGFPGGFLPGLTFLLLFFLWVGLAWLRKSL